MKKFKQLLIELDACKEAIDWAEDKTIEEVVETCHRGDWLLWLAQKLDIGLKPLTLAKGHCANTVRHLMKDKRSINAVDTAIAFGEGKASIEELNSIAVAARSTISTAFATAAYSAATIAAYSAVAAASNYAADASNYAAAASAAAYTYGKKGKKENQMLTADICRKYIGDLIIKKVNEKL